jgi:hypothetical protein
VVAFPRPLGGWPTSPAEYNPRFLKVEQKQPGLRHFSLLRSGLPDCQPQEWKPVKRGLVLEPWAWSSFRHYDIGERGPVLVNETQKAELRMRKVA